jgi:glutamate-1-semialdehyde 2,1-aminomutase
MAILMSAFGNKNMKKFSPDDPFSGKGQDLYVEAKRLMPGGTQLLSKRPELFLPDRWPAYYSKAEGCTIWDLDGRRYKDFTQCGVGTTTLGYSDSDVNKAVELAIRAGSMSTLNCPEEVELAELLIELHPWAEMVRYARSGGEAMALAIRIARSATGRDNVAFCGYHGWTDWYLSANILDNSNLDEHMLPNVPPAGVPAALGGTTFPFRYNRLDELKQIAAEQKGNLAAIVMEPRGHSEAPNDGYLEEIRKIANSVGAVLVFDEVTSGWRMNTGGIHMTYGINPDIAVFAKSISNGYAMAAIIGMSSVMEAAQKSFISSSYWTEKIGPVAALATIKKHRRENVPHHIVTAGQRIQNGWAKIGEDCNLPLSVLGVPPLSWFRIENNQRDALTTLFTQEMLRRGFLASHQCYTMLAHTEADIEEYLAAVSEVFDILAAAIADGDVENRLAGPVKHSSLKRLN